MFKHAQQGLSLKPVAKDGNTVVKLQGATRRGSTEEVQLGRGMTLHWLVGFLTCLWPLWLEKSLVFVY